MTQRRRTLALFATYRGLHESRLNAEQGIGKLAHEVNTQQTEWLTDWWAMPAYRAENPDFANIHTLELTHAARSAARAGARGLPTVAEVLQRELVSNGRTALGAARTLQLLAAVRWR